MQLLISRQTGFPRKTRSDYDRIKGLLFVLIKEPYLCIFARNHPPLLNYFQLLKIQLWRGTLTKIIPPDYMADNFPSHKLSYPLYG